MRLLLSRSVRQLIFATLVTLFVVPVFYNLLARFTKSPMATARRIEAFEDVERHS